MKRASELTAILRRFSDGLTVLVVVCRALDAHEVAADEAAAVLRAAITMPQNTFQELAAVVRR
jgi:hypothetical protein